ncbi:DUF4272 domain-containing protein [Cytophaga aurantiaca]|uniref:DUF4272 domain-containing protein n=1 Tax=Cytophaga aurantiaca TaxID=29530 RepID=UPI0003669494|nr:DUF4272 domain-containing protein [Cytophaga aurantiaca]
MTAQQRKQQTETFLKSLGIPVYDGLPAIEEENVIKVRTVQEITARIMILTYLNCIATQHALQPEILEYLKTEGLWVKTSPSEKILFEKPALTEDDINLISWRAESIWLLLWSIHKVEHLTMPIEEVDIDALFLLLPPFMGDPTEYIADVQTRSVSDLLNEADFLFRLNWAISKNELEGLNGRIAFERYYTINWITSTRKEWDDHVN